MKCAGLKVPRRVVQELDEVDGSFCCGPVECEVSLVGVAEVAVVTLHGSDDQLAGSLATGSDVSAVGGDFGFDGRYCRCGMPRGPGSFSVSYRLLNHD